MSERFVSFAPEEDIDIWCVTCGCPVLTAHVVEPEVEALGSRRITTGQAITAYPCGHTDGISFVVEPPGLSA